MAPADPAPADSATELWNIILQDSSQVAERRIVCSSRLDPSALWRRGGQGKGAAAAASRDIEGHSLEWFEMIERRRGVPGDRSQLQTAIRVG